MPLDRDLYPDSAIWQLWSKLTPGSRRFYRKVRVILTTAHLDHDPANNDDDNLAALCQRCHLNHDRTDNLHRRRDNRDRRDGRLTLFPRKHLDGAIFSVLSALDGCTEHLPAFDLVARPAEDEMSYQSELGHNWVEDGTVISVMLHDHWYEKAEGSNP